MLTTLRDTSDSFENFRLDPQRFFENGEKIVAVLNMTGRGRTSGVPVEERIAHLWTLREGLAIELRAFTDRPTRSRQRGCRASSWTNRPSRDLASL